MTKHALPDSAQKLATHVTAGIAAVHADTAGSIAQLVSRGVSLLAEGKIGVSDLYGPKDISRLNDACRRHRKAALRVARAKHRGQKTQMRMAKTILLESFHGRLCAVIRAAAMTGYIPPAQLFEIAVALNPYEALTEAVHVWWKMKSPTSFRMIASGWIKRRAQQILLRDLLTACGFDSPIDFTRSKSGGERAFVGNVREKMLEGYDYWVTPDVIKAFSSMKPAHFKTMGLDRRLIRNVAFVPKCAKVSFTVPRKAKAIAILKERDLLTPKSEAAPTTQVFKLSGKLVRQALSEGSPISPLLARSFIGRELQAALGEENVVRFTYMDDLAIGARTPNEAQAAIDAVKQRLGSSPAGPIDLKNTKVRPRERVTLLGYRLRPEPRKGKPFIHAKPGLKRTDRFKIRLKARLIAAKAEGKDVWAVRKEYGLRWFDSQQAWTKVPCCSKQVSLSWTHSYVQDFEWGIPMGENAPLIGSSAKVSRLVASH